MAKKRKKREAKMMMKIKTSINDFTCFSNKLSERKNIAEISSMAKLRAEMVGKFLLLESLTLRTWREEYQ